MPFDKSMFKLPRSYFWDQIIPASLSIGPINVFLTEARIKFVDVLLVSSLEQELNMCSKPSCSLNEFHLLLKTLPLIFSCSKVSLMNERTTGDNFASSDPSTMDPYPVYTGIWTNWSRGKIMGATLTLNRQDADLLIAFSAFFIAFISTRTWRILCFCFHRSFSTSSPQDIVYHQRQVILRNSNSPENSIYLLWQLLWATRHLKKSLQILPAIVTAIS